MRRGYDAIDGKIGDATTDAYNAYMAVLEGADKSTYEDDYRAANGGKAPVYGQVAGRTPEEVRAYTNMYYDYFKRYPEAYASLAEGNRELIGYALPYMNDEVMRLLSQNVLEGYQSPEDNASINVNKLARKGLLGSRGDEMLQEAEKINVREAIDRGGLNTLHLATLALRSGQLAMGMAANALFGDNPWEEDGLQYVKRYNPVTGAVENVLVPKAGTTFADAANVENEVGRMVVNTLTDPFFWLSMAPTVKTAASNFKSTLKNGSGYFRGYPEPAANNVMVPHNNADIVVPGGRINNQVMRELESQGRAVRVQNGTTSTAARGGTRATTRGSGAVRGNTRGTGWQQTWGNQPSQTVGSTSTSATWDLLPGEMPSIPELEPIPLNMPFIAPPPMPAPSYKGPSSYAYTMPQGTYAWQYSEQPVGNDFIIFNGGAGGEQLLRNASADTHNYWRARNPQYGTGRRWDGDYLSGK